jgi:hypothetical protein
MGVRNAIITVIILRVAGYIYMLFQPFAGFVLSMFLDIVDWYILVLNGLPREHYHKVDKPLDYLCYIFLIPVLIGTPVFPLYIATMIYRGIGHVIYHLYGNRRVFILFADLPQIVALLYFFSEAGWITFNILDPKILAICFVAKMIYEVLPHVYSKGQTWDLIQKILSGRPLSRSV